MDRFNQSEQKYILTESHKMNVYLPLRKLVEHHLLISYGFALSNMKDLETNLEYKLLK